MEPEAVIFDMDGTLLDSEHVWDRVRRDVAAEAGVEFPESSVRAMMGMSTPEWATHMIEVVGVPGPWQRVAETVVGRMVDNYRAGDIEVLPGAREAVQRMAADHPVAIASSSPRRLIEAGAEMLGIAPLLAGVVSTEEVGIGKPAPDGYLRAAGLCGADPAGCLAVEDSTNGILSALNAGMKVVVVPPHFNPPSADLLGRTTVIASLEELTPELVASL